MNSDYFEAHYRDEDERVSPWESHMRNEADRRRADEYCDLMKSDREYEHFQFDSTKVELTEEEAQLSVDKLYFALRSERDRERMSKLIKEQYGRKS